MNLNQVYLPKKSCITMSLVYLTKLLSFVAEKVFTKLFDCLVSYY